jgi:hypothetical protein
MTTHALNSRPSAKRSDKRPDAQPFFERLEKSLVKYVVDATAAGVGLLALATPANADTISQSVRINIPLPHPIGVSGSTPHWRARPDQGQGSAPLSHFSFKTSRSCIHGPDPGPGAAIVTRFNALGKAASDQLMIGPLKKGATIGPGGAFARSGVMVSSIRINDTSGCQSGPFGGGRGGPWLGATGYMGLEFDINGEPHFGWAQLTVLGINDITVDGEFYNPVANQGIGAGDTTSIPEPGTLGLLALGCFGLGLWRKRQAARRN